MIHPYNYLEPVPDCPNRGHKLTEKKVRSGKGFRRKLVYDTCTNCDYKHLQPSEKELAIEEGLFDNEQSIIDNYYKEVKYPPKKKIIL